MQVRELTINYKYHDLESNIITCPKDAAKFIRSILPDNSREHFVVIHLESQHRIASFNILSTGTVSSTSSDMRELFTRALLAGCTAIITAHNHPGQSLNISKEDKETYERIKLCAKLLNIKYLDNLIITDTEYLSFQERSLL